MPHGSYSLGETAAKQKMRRLVCDECGRQGQHQVDNMVRTLQCRTCVTSLRSVRAGTTGAIRTRSNTLIDWRSLIGQNEKLKVLFP